MIPSNILYQGAEAILILEDNKLIKRRIRKNYRVPEIDDKLRKLRTRSESKIMQKLSGIINVPKIIKADENSREIIMQYIEGKKLSDNLDKLKNKNNIMQEVGKQVSILHNNNIIHGDLTTSNMILVENSITNKNKGKPTTEMPNKSLAINNIKNKNDKIFLIDFGLSFHSSRIEDKAVDLHLLKQALEAKHYKHYKELFSSFLETYNPKDKTKIISQLEKVELRGRYKH